MSNNGIKKFLYENVQYTFIRWITNKKMLQVFFFVVVTVNDNFPYRNLYLYCIFGVCVELLVEFYVWGSVFVTGFGASEDGLCFASFSTTVLCHRRCSLNIGWTELRGLWNISECFGYYYPHNCLTKMPCDSHLKINSHVASN